MDSNELKFYSNSPHAKGRNSTRRIMLNVCLALLPACVTGCVFFGWKALLIIALSAVSAVASEVVFLLVMKKPFSQIVREFDFSSLVTGLLLAMCLSAEVDWYVPVLSAIFAVVVVKMLFGGTGKNLVNPALGGRIFAFLSFGALMNAYAQPFSGEVITGATSLTGLLADGTLPNNLDLLLGNVAGCIGETCKIALIAGGLYLVIRGILDWRWPVIYLAVTGLMSVALNAFDFNYFLPSILSGGLMLGAIFMATDYTTTPDTTWGNVLYFVLLGVVTAVLRFFAQIEIVSFAIFLMNLFVPLIDKFIINRPFGYVKVKKTKEAKQ